MTSEPPRGGRAGSVVTALIVLVCIVILAGLGVWQVKRLHWKEDLLRRVAAAQVAAPQPIGPVLARLRAGQDVEWTRVEARCAAGRPGAGSRTGVRYGILAGEVVWRAITDCPLKAAPYRSIQLDRGVIDAARGQVQKPAGVDFAPAQQVVGVLRRPARKDKAAGPAEPGTAPMMLVVDRESPPPAGLTPAAYPTNIPNNHLGYAITWFGLALALAGVYGAALWKRRRPR